MIAYLLAAALACDPALTALFTPPRPSLGRYEVCTTTEPFDDAAAGAGGPHYGPSELLEPLDAFGAAGSYSRAALTRLYAGKRVRVARIISLGLIYLVARTTLPVKTASMTLL